MQFAQLPGSLRWAFVCLGLAVELLCAAISTAQDTSRTDSARRPAMASPTAQSVGVSESGEVSPLDRLPAKVIYLPDELGKLVAVPVDATLPGYLAWVAQKRRPVASDGAIPPVAASSVELVGSAEDQFVLATCRIVVHVTEEGAQLYSLGLAEAMILKETVEGPGRTVFGGRDRERGYGWWLEGKGQYVFELELAIPLLKASPWRRLQLSLPAAPVNRVTLAVPYGNVTVKAAEDVLWTTRQLDEQRTELRSNSFGGRLDVSWQPTATATDRAAGLDVDSVITVRIAHDAFLIETTQFVRALQGTFREFTVRLPQRGELLQVEGAEISGARREGTSPDRMTVTLNSATAGPVKIVWNLRLPHAGSRRFELDGDAFVVVGAKRQSGQIGLMATEGFRWNISGVNDPHIIRMNAGEFRNAPNGLAAARAFRYFAQPFRLPMALEAVEPFYDVTTKLALSVAQDDVRLDGRFLVRTFRGQLSQLTLHWPEWRTEGWVLEGIQPQGSVVTNLTTDDEAGDGRIVVSLADELPDAFELRLQARRSRRTPDDGRCSLPRLSGPAGSSTRLMLLRAENVDAELLPRGETVLRPQRRQVEDDDDGWTFSPSLRPQEYRIDTEERLFHLSVTPQERRVNVESVLSGEWANRSLTVRQQLKHTVDYARLNDVILSVPASIAERVRIFHAGYERSLEWSAAPAGKREKLARLVLPEPSLGAVTLEAVWDIPLADDLFQDRAVALSIPIIRSLSGATSATRLRIAQSAWMELSMSTAGWNIERDDDQELVWSTAAVADSVSLRALPSATPRGREILAKQAVARIQIDRAGVQHSRFDVQISGRPRQLHVQLPKEAVAEQFFWNEAPLPAEAVVEVQAGSRRFTVAVPELSGTEPAAQLTMMYRVPAEHAPSWQSQYLLDAPNLIQCRWVADIVWDVGLPADQHLFNYSSEVTPLFHWERVGAIWRRVSPTIVASPGINTANGALRGGQHNYVFGQFGALRRLQIRSITTPAALLFGAGATLVLGFILLKTPGLPVVFSTGMVALGGLMIALWFPTQMEILVQPMLLGALFPIGSGLLRLWRKPDLGPTVVTIAPPVATGELRPGSDHVPGTPSLRAVHADSATAFRQPVLPTAPDDVRLAAESHVG